MLTTFLRESDGQPYEGGGDGLDCHCVSSTDADGKVNHIFFVRRTLDRTPLQDPPTFLKSSKQ